MNVSSKSRVCLLAICLMAVSACMQTAPKSPTVRVCDPHCSERPRDHVDQDLSEISTDPRALALEEAARDNPRAAYDLALRYFRGDGVRRDSYQALTWMRTAAEGGELEAQKALGRVYLTGLEEMGADPREAHTWLSLAAGRGDAESAELLKQAERARTSSEADWAWRQQWRNVFHGYWYRSYRYFGRWNGYSWVY